MNSSYIIFAMFALASVAPLLGAVAVYRDNLNELVVPPLALEAIGDLQDNDLVTYVGDEVVDLNGSMRIFFDVSNPFNASISVSAVSMRAYCHEHGTYIGEAAGEALPLEIPAGQRTTLGLLLSFTEDGRADVDGHYNSGDELYLDLKDIDIVVLGVEISYSGDVAEIGPIPLG